MTGLLKYHNIHDNPDSLNNDEFAYYVEMLNFIKKKEAEQNK